MIDSPRAALIQEARKLLNGFRDGEWYLDVDPREDGADQVCRLPKGHTVAFIATGMGADEHRALGDFISAAPRLIRDLLALLDPSGVEGPQTQEGEGTRVDEQTVMPPERATAPTNEADPPLPADHRWEGDCGCEHCRPYPKSDDGLARVQRVAETLLGRDLDAGERENVRLAYARLSDGDCPGCGRPDAECKALPCYHKPKAGDAPQGGAPTSRSVTNQAIPADTGPHLTERECRHHFADFVVCRRCGQTEAAALGECHHCSDDDSVTAGRCWWCLRPRIAAVPPSPWKPIAEAPKDGTEILGFDGRDRRVVYWWDSGTTVLRPHWFAPLQRHGSGGAWEPTHFQPLPDPPVSPGSL